jgi:RHS repeat-associated protein
MTNNTTFVYDGWNPIGKLNATNNNVLQSYLWGQDLSGSMQGAGGVGGLLEISDAANGVHFAAYDGNGNVAGLVTAANGTSSAIYEYGPFGELLRATGPMAKANPLRFSTKYQDDETDLLYYGYRYLNTSTGRWLSTDPAEEEGFSILASSSGSRTRTWGRRDAMNLYAFVANAPVGFYDRLGLECLLCGPNVTSPLSRLISKLHSTWNGVWSQSQKDNACNGLTDLLDSDPSRGGGPAFLMAWDIDMLWQGNQGWINAPPYHPPCATQPACVNTVQVGSQCYYAGSVNYVLFGHMCSLCGFRKNAMIDLIWLYKHNSPNYGPSRDWANAGFDGWPGGGAKPPQGDRPRCSPSCPVAYSGPAFKFYWYPNGWN